MKDSEAGIAIGVLGKLIDQELEAVRADCMWRLKFQPVKTIPLDSYRLFEQWLLSRSEAEEETRGRYDR